MFKLKPQKNDQDGRFLLIIECGTQSSSMSIKVLPSHSLLLLQEIQPYTASLCWGYSLFSLGQVTCLLQPGVCEYSSTQGPCGFRA